MDLYLKPGERIDDLYRKGYHILQHPEKYCFSVDAVLLADFARVKHGGKVLDMGTGGGIIPILMEARTGERNFTGLEIQPDLCDMAERSVRMNQLEDKISIVEGDMKEASDLFGGASFDVVTCNPPYTKKGEGKVSRSDGIAIARHEIYCTLEDVIREAAIVVKPGGSFYMIHRPRRLPEIMTLMQENHLEPRRMRLVYSYLDKGACMVLLEGVRGGGAELIVEKPLILYEEPGVYTEEVQEIYFR